MNSNLQLVASRHFDNVILDCYQEIGQDNQQEFFATREQIGLALGYENPRKAIKDIHERHKERLDRFSHVVKLSYRTRGAQNEPPSTNQQNTTVYNFKGLLEICRYSQQPNANKVIDVLWEIADEIRRTGSYNASISKDELEFRNKQLDEHRREQDLLGAQILQSMIDKELFPLTPETRTVFAHEVFKLVTGHSYLGMLPECSEKWYTAGEIGEAVGLSANMVGRIAKANGLKAHDGESNEYGRWIFSKSKHSNREVPSFIYNEDALDWFKHFLKGEIS